MIRCFQLETAKLLKRHCSTGNSDSVLKTHYGFLVHPLSENEQTPKSHGLERFQHLPQQSLVKMKLPKNEYIPKKNFTIRGVTEIKWKIIIL